MPETGGSFHARAGGYKPVMLSPSPPLPPDLWASPRWFPQLIDPNRDRILLVERDEANLHAASFLDDRSLPQGGGNRHFPSWRQVSDSMPADARRDAQYIFHIGHVGSTLIARLLGELPAVLSLREPLPLRTLSEQTSLRGKPECAWAPDSFEVRIGLIIALLSRTFRPQQRALVKATSFTSEVAADLVPVGSKALLLYSPAKAYVENILAGDASRAELQMLAGSRVARLNRRMGEPRWRLWELDLAAKAGLAWACEMTSLHQAASRLPEGSTLWVDFDAFLAAPAASLERIARFFEIPLDQDTAARLCAGPLMSRYSKALEYEYSPGLRQQVLAQSRSEHGETIAGALAWINAAAHDYPPLADCIARKD